MGNRKCGACGHTTFAVDIDNDGTVWYECMDCNALSLEDDLEAVNDE